LDDGECKKEDVETHKEQPVKESKGRHGLGFHAGGFISTIIEAQGRAVIDPRDVCDSATHSKPQDPQQTKVTEFDTNHRRESSIAVA